MNEANLKTAFVALLDVIKMQTEQIASLMKEVSAIRETVKALDPTFSETFAVRRQEAENRVLASLSKQIAYIDGLTRQMNKPGEIF